jgi:pSer/pThr/pTyr-binding forkhead associated (FHA) protein
MPTFTISVNNKVLGTYVVKKTVISVGRSRTNTISIASKAVSRNHVRIENTAEGWTITDLGSLNGTYVNDIRINSAFLSEGDRVTVGAYAITFSPEPALASGSGETHVATVHAAGAEGTDTDVRVESSTAGDTSAAPKEQTDVAESAEPVSVPQPPKTTSIPVQSVVEEIADSETQRPSAEPDTAQVKISSVAVKPHNDARKQDSSSLPLEDIIKLAISENPLADETWLRTRLGESDFGGVRLSKQQLQALLKKMDLDSSLKRYHHFMNS